MAGATDAARQCFSSATLATEVNYASVPFAERVIEVRTRELDGKYEARRVRANGEVPGVLFGGSRWPMARRKANGAEASAAHSHDHLLVAAVDYLALETELRVHGLGFFCLPYQLKVDGEDTLIPVLPRSFHRHPVSRDILSLNYQRLDVSTKKAPKVSISVSYVDHDRCPGLKLGGYLNQAKRDVMCRIHGTDYDKIPSGFVLSLAKFESLDRVRVGDVTLPAEASETLELLDNPTVHLASIVGRKGKAAEVDAGEEVEEIFV